MLTWLGKIIKDIKQKIAYRKKLKKRLKELKLKDPYDYK